MKRPAAIGAVLIAAFMLISCGGDVEQLAETTGSVTVRMKADFLSSVAGSPSIGLVTAALANACPATPTTMDDPGYAAGLDCDLDGGLIQYVTPSSFKVAFKKLDFVKDDGTLVSMIPDGVVLSNSTVLDLTSEITLSSQSFPLGNYSGAVAEIYYYEIKMPLNSQSTEQTIRVYLSDDDFPSEGGLGHHQGDITFIDLSGNELGWVLDGAAWTQSNLLSSRGFINGAGGTDPDTGHLRGLFGDTTLWNQPRFMQGADRDVFIMDGELNLSVGDTARTVTFTFDVKDSWFYEDFDGNQVFNPCGGDSLDACASNAEWAPIFKEPDIALQ